MANRPYDSGLRSREALMSRPSASSDEVQVQIDPMHADLDDQIYGLRGQLRKLKGVALEIESEAKYQNDFISQLSQRDTVAEIITRMSEYVNTLSSIEIGNLKLKGQSTLTKAQAGVKNNMRRMNKKIIQNGSNHLVHVVLFALFCFFVVYLISKFSKR